MRIEFIETNHKDVRVPSWITTKNTTDRLHTTAEKVQSLLDNRKIPNLREMIDLKNALVIAYQAQKGDEAGDDWMAWLSRIFSCFLGKDETENEISKGFNTFLAAGGFELMKRLTKEEAPKRN